MSARKQDLGSIAIIGGGITGLTLAIALLQRGLDVRVYEQAPRFGEIGAGVSFNPAATRAMQICSPDVRKAFEAVATHNQSKDKQKVFFDWLDGMNDTEVGKEEWKFSVTNESGANAVHRAHFLDQLVHVLPEGVTHFHKHLDTIEELDDGTLRMKFHDGTDAKADAVIGCDGIKSRVRAWIVGDDHPSAHAVYTHKYAYRGLIPAETAKKELGEDLASNAKMHTGQDGHLLTFPVDKGKTMNVVAFKTDPNEWASEEKMTLPSKKSHVYEDFKDFGATVHKIIDLLDDDLDCWAIFDTGDHPMPHYNKGNVVVLGDAAHATSPHHGSGAGMCIEDAAVMAELLMDPTLAGSGRAGFAPAFAAYSEQRLERTQWLVQSSRRAGDLWEWRAEGVGRDLKKIEEECRERHAPIWNGQVTEYIKEARQLLAKAIHA